MLEYSNLHSNNWFKLLKKYRHFDQNIDFNLTKMFSKLLSSQNDYYCDRYLLSEVGPLGGVGEVELRAPELGEVEAAMRSSL